MSGFSVTTVCCQNVPPMVVLQYASTAPTPINASCVSAPPITTFVSAVSPVSLDAFVVTSPTTVPGSSTSGNIRFGSPHHSIISFDQALLESWNKSELEPADGSVANFPESL